MTQRKYGYIIFFCALSYWCGYCNDGKNISCSEKHICYRPCIDRKHLVPSCNNDTDLLQTCSPPHLSNRVGGSKNRSIVEGTLSAPLLRGHSGASTPPSMTGAAGGLVARRYDYGLSFKKKNFPVFIEFCSAFTKTRAPALLAVCVEPRESLRRSFHRFHGSLRGRYGSYGRFQGSFHGSNESGGSFHGRYGRY